MCVCVCVCCVCVYTQVADTEQLLRTWATRVTKLRSQHQWLLFFSVPKQLLLYQLIQQCEEENMEECVELMVREVMFLVANDPITREDLSNDIEVNLIVYPHNTK